MYHLVKGKCMISKTVALLERKTRTYHRLRKRRLFKHVIRAIRWLKIIKKDYIKLTGELWLVTLTKQLVLGNIYCWASQYILLGTSWLVSLSTISYKAYCLVKLEEIWCLIGETLGHFCVFYLKTTFSFEGFHYI